MEIPQYYKTNTGLLINFNIGLAWSSHSLGIGPSLRSIALSRERVVSFDLVLQLKRFLQSLSIAY